jgi:hypothetical protein
MAYALKYTSTFFQVKSYSTSGEWIIKIYEEGYGGGVTTFDPVKDSIQLSRGGDWDTAIRTTTLDFAIYNATESQYIEFADANWGDYKVELIFDPNGTPITKFVGYNQTEIYTEPFDLEGIASLTFTDGLSHLEYVRWDDSGTLYTGQKTIIEVLRLALNKLPSPIAIREMVNVYEDSILSTTTDSMLNQIYVDSTLYKEQEKEGGQNNEVAFMANQVIDEILKPLYCQIYQWNGIWYIWRKQEYKDTTIYYRDFNANVGTESTVTVDGTGNFTANKRSITNKDTVATDIWLPSSPTEKEVTPPLNRVKVTYNQQNLEFANNDIIKDGCFEDITLVSGATTNNGSPTWWTESSGLDTTTYFAFNSPSWAFPDHDSFQFDPSSYKTATSLNVLEYIQQTKTDVPTAVTDKIQLSFKAGLVLDIDEVVLNSGSPTGIINNYINSSMTVTWEILFKIDTYYLSGDNVNGYSWTTTVSNAKFISTGSNIWQVTVISGYANQFKRIPIEFNETLPLLPQTGLKDVTFRVYQPYTDIPSYSTNDPDWTVVIDSLYQGCFSAIYLPDEVDPEQEQILYADIREDEEYLEIDVMHGDGSNTISQGSFRLSTGVITDLWNRRGVVENIPILTILINSLRDDRSDFIDTINGQLIGEFEAYNSFSITINAITKHYALDTFTYNLETNEWDVSLIELETFAHTITLTDSPITTGTEQTTNPVGNGQAPDPSNQKTGGGGNLVISTSTSTSTNQTNLTNFN